MNKRCLLLFVVYCLSILLVQLRAGSFTYDFTSVADWVTKSGGDTHPGTGSLASLTTFYHAATNDDFVGSGSVYFSADGYLMISTDASLKLPYRSDWTITKITLHAHSGCSTSAKVNIYSEYGTSLSTAQQWQQKDSDYEYAISTSYRKLFVKSTGAAARITSITIEYASADDSTDDPSDDLPDDSSVSRPIFTPGSSSFSSNEIVVTIDAAEGCEVYYTTDGSVPSYTNAEEYHGTKGDVVTISADDSQVTLQAIAVDPITGECSGVSSATYTYTRNDGDKLPYTVAELRSMLFTTKENGKWVKGTICGAVDGNSNIVTSDITIASNLAIGNEKEYVAVQLPAESKIREAVNLKDHPYMKGKEILVKGDLEAYMMPTGVGVKNPSDFEIIYEVPINSYGYATLYLDMPVLLPAGVTAYYCTVEDHYAKLFSVGSVIPSNTGVILESTTHKNTTCALTYTTSRNADEAAILEDNKLVGFMHDTQVGSDGSAYYALNVKNNQLGFYIPQTAADPGDAASGFTAKAKKAYLQVPAEQKASMFVIHRAGDESAIVPSTHMCDEAIYDLQGRIVVSPTSGVYIRGGQKFVVRK